MKTNQFLRPFAVMMMTAFVSACTQDNLDTQNTAGKKILTVNVTESGFNTSGEGSRATDEDYSTTFETNDKIGVIIVDADNGELIQNTFITKGESSWEGKIYYYENADYLAYYPYDENMEDVTSLNEIKTYFSENKFSWNQSTKEAYRNADLITSEVKEDNIQDGGSLNFNFTHANAMVEFNVPYYSYTTAETDGYDYSVPVNLSLEMSEEETEFSPYQMAVGKYRVIIPAGMEKSFTGKFNDAKDNKPVNISADSYTFEAGKAKVYNVTYTDGPTVGEKEPRAIQPGDYYYADGNIVPNDFKNIPDGCIGVVFASSTLDETAKDGETICKNGYVMALIDATGNAADKENSNAWTYYWGYDNTTIAGLYMTTTSDDNKSVASAVTDNTKSGLYNTSLISSSTNYSSNNDYIQHAVKTFGAEGYITSIYAASEKTTGWFIPSAAQFVSIIKNLGSNDGNFSYDGSDYSVTDYDGTQKIWFNDVVTKINEKLSTVDGKMDQHKSYMTVSMVDEYSYTKDGVTTKYTNVPLYLNHSSSNKKADFNPVLLTENGTETKRNVRLILAF